jgi:translation initiation factor 2 subunit 2
MEDYSKLLDEAYKKVKVVANTGERFAIPKVQGQVQGKNTIITNIAEIANYLRRPLDQITKFLLKELATSGKIQNDRLILHTKLNSSKVNEKIQLYAKELVICPVCQKPDTEITTQKGLKQKHCLACGAYSPIKHKI